MSSDHPLRYLEIQLSDRRKQIEETLASGIAKDYPEYQRLCGVISGLDFSLRELLDLANKLERDDE
jgi:hypothetical protein